MRFLPSFLAACLLLLASLPLCAQKFIPKSIQFKGASEYSDQELLAAASLKPGATLTSVEMNDHSKLLMDSGVFDGITYKFDGQDLIYQLTVAPQLYPIRLENLPLVPGPQLDAKIHARQPLYHGKVPAEGTLLQGVIAVLEESLAGQGVHATVAATPFGVPGTKQVSAISFAISAPPVRIGPIKLAGPSIAMQGRARAFADHASGAPFDTANSALNLERAFQSFYADEGFAAVKVHAERSGPPVAAAAAIDLPFTVTIDEGRLYKLGQIHLPPGAPIAQAEIDKYVAAALVPLKPAALRSIWGVVSARYKAKGYLDCVLNPIPSFDEPASTVNYTLEANTGPVYHLGFVKFENVTDDLRRLLIKNWQMLAGDPFDESYVSSFIFKAQTADPILARSLVGIKTNYQVTADPTTHEVNVVLRLQKLQ
jgi:outer membrane protein assembly factor BamA